MTQSRLGSFIEAVVNIVIGFWIAVGSQYLIFPMVGINDMPMSTHLEIGAYFTLVSLVRSYVIRRWFNARIHKAAQSLASRVE